MMVKLFAFTVLLLAITEALGYVSYYGDSYNNCVNVRNYRKCTFWEKYSSFRSIDGHCNNRWCTTWGGTHVPMRRFVPAAYADPQGYDVPRGYPGVGPELPSANLVSEKVFTTEFGNVGSRKRLSTLFMTFGQFLDHDVTETPSASASENCPKNCAHRSSFRYPCFPILFKTTNDHTSSKCTPFGRSRPACRVNKGVREQVNDLTSFVDGSQVYSAVPKHFQALRTKGPSGELKITKEGLLPFDTTRTTPCQTKGGCSLVGDPRGDENIALHSMHTLWVREHNRLAKGLRKLNPHWNGERIFQTARKINSAEWQHIVYQEWLPHLVNTRRMRYQGYKWWVNPGLFNSFSTAAFRFGHSLIPDKFALLDKNFDKAHEPMKLQNVFFNREPVNAHGIETVMYGLTGNQSTEVDTGFADSILNKLFVPPGEMGHMDLTARNIQRGRDHGLPPYGKFRQACGLRRIKNWIHLKKYMPNDAVKGFKKIYKHPDHIDLYAAGVAEFHIKGKAIGPIFECLLRAQFRNLMHGDRFFYRAPGIFSRKQRRALFKIRMASVLCANMKDIVSIQKHAFFVAGRRNRRITCGRIPKLNLREWKDNSKGDEMMDEELNDVKDDEGEQKNGFIDEEGYDPRKENEECKLKLMEEVTEDEDDFMDDEEDDLNEKKTTSNNDGEATSFNEYELEPKPKPGEENGPKESNDHFATHNDDKMKDLVQEDDLW